MTSDDHVKRVDPNYCGCGRCVHTLRLREQFAAILVKRLKEVDRIKWKEPRIPRL